MALSDKQLEKMREELLEIRDGLAGMSSAVREQAKDIKQAGRKIDKVFEKIADVDQFPNKISREDFKGLLESIKELNKAAQGLKKGGSE
jgi:methyl-accepting chemotaxis protein